MVFSIWLYRHRKKRSGLSSSYAGIRKGQARALACVGVLRGSLCVSPAACTGLRGREGMSSLHSCMSSLYPEFFTLLYSLVLLILLLIKYLAKLPVKQPLKLNEKSFSFFLIINCLQKWMKQENSFDPCENLHFYKRLFPTVLHFASLFSFFLACFSDSTALIQILLPFITACVRLQKPINI